MRLFLVLSIVLLPNFARSAPKTTAIDSLNQLAWESMSSDFSMVLHYAHQADSLSDIIHYEPGKGFASIYRGWIHFYNSEYAEAYQAFNYAYDIAQKENHTQLLGRYHLSIGSYYTKLGDLDLSLQHFQDGITNLKACGDIEWENYGYNNIGVNYINQGNSEKARFYYNKALDLFTQRNDSIGIALSYSNIATCFEQEGKTDSAIYCSKQALQSARAVNYLIIIGSSQLNLANFYIVKQELKTAKQYLENAKTFYTGIDDQDGLIDAAFIEAKMVRISNPTAAILILENLKPKILEMELIQNKVSVYQTLADLYSETLDYKNAFVNLQAFVKWQDQLNSQQSSDNINELEIRYQTNEKIMEIANLHNKNELIQVKLDNKKLEEVQQRKTKYWILIISSTVASLLTVLLIVIYRNNKKTKAANVIISEQKQDVEQQKEVIEIKNKEIFDSIAYAQRIQNAILPKPSHIHSLFPDSFLVYLPKDIVAGDFYWFEQIDQSVYFAVADCTGHGVPGAMVSVVCHNALNAAIYEHQLTGPGLILDKVRTLISQTFSSEQHDIKDGMDISIGVLNRTTNQLKWAGANNPLWQVQGEQLIIHAPDKQPVGKFEKSVPFTTRTLTFEKGDQFYLFSDGFADQFGGPKNKKYKTSNLKKLILSMAGQPMSEQEKAVLTAFNDWKGKEEQLDDVCLFGFRV